MDFTKEIVTKHQPLRNTEQALRFIENVLSAELKGQSRWTFARALLVEAERSKKQRDVNVACRQLCQALENDGLLKEPVDDKKRPAKQAAP